MVIFHSSVNFPAAVAVNVQVSLDEDPIVAAIAQLSKERLKEPGSEPEKLIGVAPGNT